MSFVALLILGISACSPLSQAAASGSETDEVTPESMLTFAFDTIKSRSLHEVTVADAAMSGLRGFSSIDPAISVSRPQPAIVTLRYHDQPIGTYSAPSAEDSGAWARLIAKADSDAAAMSPAMRNAGNEKLYEAVLDSTLASLDRFSRYAGAREAREHRAARNGFGGIGIRYDFVPNGIVLTEIVSDSPAGRARLKIGDQITAIDGTPTGGRSRREIADVLRGPVSSEVELTILPEGTAQSEQVTLKRSLIVPTTVTEEISDGIAVIAVSGFNQNTAASARAALDKARATAGFQGVILDLRGNPGGLLDQGVAVADLFMEHGRIVTTRGRNPASMQSYDAKPGDPGEGVPLVVLVDGRTASAAEIVSAALEDSGRAVLVGTNSFGKGTVQTVIRMPNDGEMTLTWSRFYSPSGYVLHGLGVLPAICTADDKAEPAALLAGLAAEHSAFATNIAAWRSTAFDQAEARKLLRESCPAGKHVNVARDIEIARDLIADRNAYARALNLAGPVSTARAESRPSSEISVSHIYP